MKLFPLLILLPFLEILIMIRVSAYYGLSVVFWLCVISAVSGVVILKYGGTGVFNKIRQELSAGHVPTDRLVGGIFGLLAAILLILPGFLTDITGLLLLMPFIRHGVQNWFLKNILGLFGNSPRSSDDLPGRPAKPREASIDQQGEIKATWRVEGSHDEN
jgi:UPF0716 protein FxsA